VIARLLLLAGVLAASGPQPEVTNVGVHLFLSEAGEFSPDIASIPEFVGRNGHASGRTLEDQAFGAVLIKVWFRSDPDTFHPGQQALVVVRDEGSGRPILKQPVKDLYFGTSGRLAAPILLVNQMCGPFLVEVTRGPELLRTLQLPLVCGD
jgi:hypothetical protein